ncbi:hypothetical protein [Natronomonas sp. LN261]|jgi:hypothetical protein|uniref:hypothetical protein n=1 Tax=Natronomonas sp. LN261 TaxID=2750669 RepID=UPI0015EE62B0|nr:hypothetical protein [Natronomonas sp. LN261]
MPRILLAALGAGMTLFPDRILAAYERVAFENPDDADAKSWLPAAIRAEGALYVLLCVLGGAAYGWFVRLVGGVGAVVAVFPRRYLGWGGRLAYERPDDLRWRAGFVAAVRGLGVLLTLFAVRALRRE